MKLNTDQPPYQPQDNIDSDITIKGTHHAQENNLGNKAIHGEFKHDSEKSYICTVCNKKFSWAGNLKRHTLIHTCEKTSVKYVVSVFSMFRAI